MYTWPLYSACVQHANADDLVLVTPTVTGLDCFAVTLREEPLRFVKRNQDAAIGLTVELMSMRREVLAGRGAVFPA